MSNMCFLQIVFIIYRGTLGSFWILIQFLLILSTFSGSFISLEHLVLRMAVVQHGQNSFNNGVAAVAASAAALHLMKGASAETLCPQLVADSRTSLTGNFSSPAWPSPYPPDATCFYRLQGVPWEGVKIKFLDFNLEPPYSNAGCLSDYLEITTTDIRDQRTFRGRYCGRSIPEPMIFLDPIVELVFRSNSAYHSSGFFATYEFIDEAYITPPTLNGTSPCGGVISGVGGLLENPGYPYGYSAGLDCLWLIRVPYQHAIYLRVHELEFQGSIANCQKAHIGIYDGYEYSLEESTILKRFCGDLRYYKTEEDRAFLSSRNRLLIRFTSTEPSKPLASTNSAGSIGFKLIWADVEFNSIENCTRMNRFPCEESRLCFTKTHIGGASTCPDLRHYCISNQLVCDSVQHCGEGESSDERNCHKTPLIIMMVAIPLTILFFGLITCFCCQKLRSRTTNNGGTVSRSSNNNGKPKSVSLCWGIGCYWNNNRNKKRLKQKQLRIGNVTNVNDSGGDGPCFTKHELLFPPFHSPHHHRLDLAPISRAPSGATGFNKHRLAPESPGASDIVSPASGFSDSESDVASSTCGFHNVPPPPSYSFSCPTHGPFRFLIPPNNGLPVLEEEYDYYYTNDEDDGDGNDEDVLRIQSDDNNTCGEEDEELGSTISSQNSDTNGQKKGHQRFPASKVISPTDMWRNQKQSFQSQSQHSLQSQLSQQQRQKHQQRGFLQRSDAVWSDNEGKSSIGSTSPGSNICPRCNCSVISGPVEDERIQKQGSRDCHWKDDGGMAGRLIGVPSLLKRKSTSFGSSSIGRRSGGGGCGGNGMNQFDSGIDTSVENVKVVSFDSSNSVESSINNSDTCGTSTVASVRWKSPCRTETVGVGTGKNDLGAATNSSPKHGTKSREITDV